MAYSRMSDENPRRATAVAVVGKKNNAETSSLELIINCMAVEDICMCICQLPPQDLKAYHVVKAKLFLKYENKNHKMFFIIYAALSSTLASGIV